VNVHVKDLDPAAFARLSALLDDALAIPPEALDTWLESLDTRDPQSGANVRALLASLKAAQAEQLCEGDALVGQGGMGTVWLAERADGLFERKVALKLVHLALVGSAAAERFARERAILASLDHPRIARLLDAGITAEGQPYLALEYVQGVPITTYCDQLRLDLRARIALFVQVLDAVQYAHRHLVIHRDLKPSNILVTAESNVRLLDFGIAKLVTGAGEARETELTQLGGRAFTPEYASPEQVTGASITTASDVYALGVVLYELLCGKRPYALKRESRGALEEAIVAAETHEPSHAAISDIDASARAASPKALRQALAGDLDTIALKALKKVPEERYTSAHEMLQDLERYLRGQPVLARPDSAAYRFGKFVMRNKLAVGAVAATTLALAIGFAAALWQAGVAREQARVARSEAMRATAVQDFLLNLFEKNSVDQPDPAKARATTARELLDLGATNIGEGLKSAPEARAEVLYVFGNMYGQLGMLSEAAKQHQAQAEAASEAFGPNDPRVANALILYADDIANLPERSAALPALERAKGILDAAPEGDSEIRGRLLLMLAQAYRYTAVDKMRAYADDAVAYYRQRHPDSSNLSVSLTVAGSARALQGDAVGAEKLFQQALAEAPREDDGQSAWVVFPLIALAETQDALGEIDEEEKSYRTADAAAHTYFGDAHFETILSEAKFGSFLLATGRREDGYRRMDSAVAAIGKGKGGYTPPFVIAVVSGLRGRALFADGRLEDAAPLIAVDLKDARENFPGSLPLVNALRSQAALDTARGRFDDAARGMEELLALARNAAAAGAPAPRNRVLVEQARLLLAQGEADAAVAALTEMTAPAYADRLPLRVQEVVSRTLLAQARLHQGRTEESISLARAALEAVVGSPLRSYYPRLEADAALRLGNALVAAGDPQQARAHLERALELRTRYDDEKSPWLLEAKVALAACLVELHDRQRAAALIAQAQAIAHAHAELGPQFTTSLSRVSIRLASR